VQYSVDNLDLYEVPFSRRLSRLMILNDYQTQEPQSKRIFCIGYTHAASDGSSRHRLIEFVPMKNGAVLPYTYTARPGLLTIQTETGQVQICFDGTQRLLFRSDNGVGLRFWMRFEPYEQFLDRCDGTVCAAYPKIGAFLFETLMGSQRHNGKWNVQKIKPEDTELFWLPDNDENLSGYIQFDERTVERPDNISDFNACVNEVSKDFDDWCRKYEPVPQRYAHIRLFAVYINWVCYLEPQNILKVPTFYFLRVGPLMRAMAWHQSYHAMILWQDLDLAVDLLYSMFTFQDEYGMLPDGASDKYVTMLAPKPAIQGFALSYILDRVGLDALTTAHCKKLYEPFCKWAEYWMTFRDRDGDGLVAYVHGDESGWDDASIFMKGMPVMTPDVAAFLILLMESCSMLAERLGKTTEADIWMEHSKDMLDKMIESFWNGEKFVCIKEDTREVLDVESIALYQPIILGDRLPDGIAAKIAQKVSDSDTFFMPYGFASESRLSELYDVTYGSFMLGLILAPVQFMMTIGLYNAGHKDIALQNARNWCDKCLEVGPQTVMIGPKQENPRPTGANSVFSMGDEARRPPGIFGSWGAAVFLALGNMLYHEENRGDTQ
jgi:putative isomerase